MIILAHRGYWRTPEEKNTLSAFVAAWKAGFGIETDVRDCDGTLVISHDPPFRNALRLDTVLARYAADACRSLLALNVKADGLQPLIADALSRHGIGSESYFLFDMAVPDALAYLRARMPCFTRESEIEREPAYLDEAAGIWLDCFHSDWVDTKELSARLDTGRRLSLVSPELHGRPYLPAWTAWRKALCRHASDNVFLCTDHPEQARDFFNAQA